MHIALPEAATRIPLERTDEAVRVFASVMARLRDAPEGSSGDLEAAATEAVETAVRGGAFLMAVLAPAGCGAALLTGVLMDVPVGWDAESAEQLRESLENIGGGDVRETTTMQTAIGTVVLAYRVPGVEQARSRRPMTLQLQAMLPEPGESRMVLLTLAAPTTLGWDTHQELFAGIVGSASPVPVPSEEVAVPQPEHVVRQVPEPAPPQPTRRPRRAPVEDDSFEDITYQL